MDQRMTPTPFTPSQGRRLVRLARETLLSYFGQGEISILKEMENDPAYSSRQGTFVTLEIQGNLRGCIGSLKARDTILKGIQENALNAAFHDFRFEQVTAQELERITIEVSILTEPLALAFKNPEDLLNKLRPGIDGVILQKGSAQATFLPQVWAQLSDPKEFLSHLCHKAGLPANAWRECKIGISTYQVQHFKES